MRISHVMSSEIFSAPAAGFLTFLGDRRGFLPQCGAYRFWQMCDCAFSFCRGGRLFNVVPRRALLFRRSHIFHSVDSVRTMLDATSAPEGSLSRRRTICPDPLSWRNLTLRVDVRHYPAAPVRLTLSGDAKTGPEQTTFAKVLLKTQAIHRGIEL